MQVNYPVRGSRGQSLVTVCKKVLSSQCEFFQTRIRTETSPDCQVRLHPLDGGRTG